MLRLLTIFFILTVNSLQAQLVSKIYYDYNWEEIQDPANATYYRLLKKHSDKHFIIEDYFITSEIQMRGYVLKSDTEKKDGFFQYYYRNGKKRAEGRYYNNIKDGLWTYWYENGRIESHGKYNYNKYRKVKNYSTGETTIIDGKTGTWEYYNIDGVLIKKVNYLNGIQMSVKYVNLHADPDYWREQKYYSTGAVQSRREKIGYKFYGTFTDYYPDGTICRKAWFENNSLKGKYEVFYPNGKLKIQGQFNSRIPSVQTHLYEDNIIGTLRKTNELDFYSGRVGEWIYYTPAGEIMRKEYYIDGEMINEKSFSSDFEYYNNGKIKNVIEKQGWRYSGKYLTYYESGKLHKKMNFYNDTLIGEYFEYYENGNIKIEGEYKANSISVFRPVSEEIFSDEFVLKTYIDFDKGKQGRWKFYSPDGKLSAEEVYRKGKLRKRKSFENSVN